MAILKRKYFRTLGLFLFGFYMAFFAQPQQAMTAEVPTGILELDGLSYPVYLFVPDQYSPVKPYPLIISLPPSSQTLEEHIKEWKGSATRKSFLVMVPTVLLPRTGDVPYRLDEWLIKLKKAISTRYRVAPGRVYLVGQDESAHYVSYLGAKYGEEFAGAASLNGSWVGMFERLIEVPDRPIKQTPFFISYDASRLQDLETTKERAIEFAEKGYLLHLEILEKDESYTSGGFKRRLFDWFEEKREQREVITAEHQNTWKEKVARWWERNIKVE